MSKAGEWAKREDERQRLLEAAREKIDAQIDRDGDGKPSAFMRDRNALFSIARVDGFPRLCVHAYSSSIWLTPEEAIDAARWLLDAFGDKS